MGKEKILWEGLLPDRIDASELFIQTFNFVTNPPHLLRDDDAIGNAINAVDNNLQQLQQMINNAPQNAAQQEVV